MNSYATTNPHSYMEGDVPLMSYLQSVVAAAVSAGSVAGGPASTAGSAKINAKVAEAIRAQMRQPIVSELPADPTPAATTEEPPKPLALGEGQVPYSTLAALPTGYPDFGVTVLKNEQLHEKVAGFVPTRDPLYRPDLTALYRLTRAFEDNDPTLITGPTGCGKSQLVRHVCALTNRPMIRVSMTEDTESSVIFGTPIAENGSTGWEDGPATEAVRYGAVLNIDEWDVTPAGVFMGFQWMLEQGGRLFLKEMPGTSADKILDPHPHTRVVMCGNTVGQGDETGRFAGVAPQNTAAIDRFRTAIRMDYLPVAEEVDMLRTASPHLTAVEAGRFVQLASLCRTAYQQHTLNLTMSPRALLNWAAKSPVYGIREALRVAYTDKLTESQGKVVDEAYNKVFAR
jgi:MoxR-like ATPase